MAAIFLLLLVGCRDADVPQPAEPSPASPVATDPAWFVDESTERGVEFRHDSGQAGAFLFPEVACGGAAVFDMEGDGDLDLYCVQSGSWTGEPNAANQLYRNDGSGRFENVTEGSGAGDTGYGMGVATGDFDNDGDVDVYVTNVGDNTLLRNEGDGTFVDVTEPSGTGHDAWSISAAFLDYDADGDLDLFVANYVNWSAANEQVCYNNRGQRTYCGPNQYGPLRDTLYRNEGNGTFTDVSQAAGLDAAFGNGMGVVCGDFNGDRRIDIFVANDMMANQLWWNEGDGTFRDGSLLAGCAMAETGEVRAGMGVDAADLDRSGTLDLLVVNLHNEADSYFRNEGGWFQDRTPLTGLSPHSQTYTRFGMGVHDFDNDGWRDLYLANGRINSRLEPVVEDDPLAEANLVYRGIGPARFQPLDRPGGTRDHAVHTSRAAAFGDLNNDGRVDILVINKDGPAYLLINSTDSGNFARFRLLDRHGRDALGATLRATVGDQSLRFELKTAYGYASAHEPFVHVGLGDEEQVANVQVDWPTGETEAFGDFAAGQTFTLEQSLPAHD